MPIAVKLIFTNIVVIGLCLLLRAAVYDNEEMEDELFYKTLATIGGFCLIIGLPLSIIFWIWS